MSVTCTPDNLADLARCFTDLSPGQLQAIQAYLLCQVANSAAGGVTSIIAGNGITVSAATGNVTVTAKTLDQIPVATGAVDFNAKNISNFTSAVNAQTGTTYTVLASDCGKIITCNNASAITVTVDTNIPDGGSVTIAQKGAGQVTISPSGLTIRSNSSYTKTAAQYAAITLFRDGTDLWLTGAGA
jgi:archaellum component FlaG (FlaF/FlaG flagellin family)